MHRISASLITIIFLIAMLVIPSVNSMVLPSSSNISVGSVSAPDEFDFNSDMRAYGNLTNIILSQSDDNLTITINFDTDLIKSTGSRSLDRRLYIGLDIDKDGIYDGYISVDDTRYFYGDHYIQVSIYNTRDNILYNLYKSAKYENNEIIVNIPFSIISNLFDIDLQDLDTIHLLRPITTTNVQEKLGEEVYASTTLNTSIVTKNISDVNDWVGIPPSLIDDGFEYYDPYNQGYNVTEFYTAISTDNSTIYHLIQLGGEQYTNYWGFDVYYDLNLNGTNDLKIHYSPHWASILKWMGAYWRWIATYPYTYDTYNVSGALIYSKANYIQVALKLDEFKIIGSQFNITVTNLFINGKDILFDSHGTYRDIVYKRGYGGYYLSLDIAPEVFSYNSIYNDSIVMYKFYISNGNVTLSYNSTQLYRLDVYSYSDEPIGFKTVSTLDRIYFIGFHYFWYYPKTFTNVLGNITYPIIINYTYDPQLLNSLGLSINNLAIYYYDSDHDSYKVYPYYTVLPDSNVVQIYLFKNYISGGGFIFTLGVKFNKVSIHGYSRDVRVSISTHLRRGENRVRGSIKVDNLRIKPINAVFDGKEMIVTGWILSPYKMRHNFVVVKITTSGIVEVYAYPGQVITKVLTHMRIRTR